MSNTQLRGGLIAAGLIVVVLVVFYAMYRPAGVPQELVLPQDDAYTAPSQVVVYHSKDAQGTHVYSGAVPMTSTCNVVSSGISTDEEPNAVRVSLALRILQAQSGSCEGVANGTTQTFYVSFIPQSSLPVKLSALSVNGIDVAYTVVEQ